MNGVHTDAVHVIAVKSLFFVLFWMAAVWHTLFKCVLFNMPLFRYGAAFSAAVHA